MSKQARIKALNEIKSVMLKHYDHIDMTRIDCIGSIDSHIQTELLLIRFGFDDILARDVSLSSRYMDISGRSAHSIESLIKLGGDCAVGWPDSGEQPADGWYYQIRFSSGAYVFGDHYPTGLFNEFFCELKSLKPECVDTANKSLYFNSTNSKEARSQLKVIYDKFKSLVSEDKRRMEIKALQAKLDGLKGGS